jgi:uncharacterized Zn-binding protein involved in type VI secretion
LSKPLSRKDKDFAGKGKIISGASKVILNDSPMARKGDSVAPHGKDKHGKKVVIAEGADKILVEYKPAAREGHKASCGCPIKCVDPKTAVTKE